MKDADKKLVKYKLKEIERDNALADLRTASWRLAVPMFILLIFNSFVAGIVANKVDVIIWPATKYVVLIAVGLVFLWMLVRLGIFIRVKDKTYEVLKGDKYTNR